MHDESMPFRSSESSLPLTPISFEILLAVMDGAQHGYAILQAVEARLGGLLPMRTGTIYRALARLLDEGLIEEASGASDERRRNYRVTAQGKAIARAEAKRLADQVARAKRLLPEPRR
jgi:DNA-binding PadR family transcriptional regulator